MKRALVCSLLTCLALVALLFPAVTAAEDWPQWRGPDRDGVWKEEGIMERFPDGGLEVRWRAPVGWGWSSPVVSAGRVYLADAQVVKPQPRERLLCFEERTGKLLWAHTWDVSYPDWTFDPGQESGPVATPIVANDRVYSVGRLGHVFCLSAAGGDVVWQRDLGKDYNVEWAPGTPSPLIEGDLLILFAGGKPDSCVVALHTHTGKEVWRALDESSTFSSPLVVTSGGKRQLIVWTQQSVSSLDPATGATYWSERLLTGSDYAVSTPVFHRDNLLVGGMMFQMAPDNPAATVLWPDTKVRSRRVFSHTSTALFRGDHVFSAKSSGELMCVDAATGKQLWENSEVTDLQNGASIHLIPNGSSVLLFNDRGELIRARLTAQGYDELSRTALLAPAFPFGGRVVAWTFPAFANGHVFVRNSKELICLSLAGP